MNAKESGLGMMLPLENTSLKQLARLAALVFGVMLATASPQLSTPAHAANLVPNPSFETYSNIPTFQDQLNYASPWQKPTTGGSSDYFHTLAAPGSGVGVPANTFGNQQPLTGQAYAGFIARPFNNYREYIEAPLSSPLAAGQPYQVSFYVSLSDESRWAVDRIGAYLRSGKVGPLPNAPTLPGPPQINNLVGNYIIDKVGWTLVTGVYVANGGEDHIVIGNFFDNANAIFQAGQGGFYNGSYYYVDDVSVDAVEHPGTIMICKQTDPPGGAGFTFGWSSPTIRTTPFVMDDDDCLSLTLEPDGGPYSFWELPPLPAGWILTNVVCTGGAGVLMGSNTVFDPGDTGVTIELGDGENIVCTFTNSTEPPPSCRPGAAGYTVIQDISTGLAGPPPAQDTQWDKVSGGHSYSTKRVAPWWVLEPSPTHWINHAKSPNVVFSPLGDYYYEIQVDVDTNLYFGFHLTFRHAVDDRGVFWLNSPHPALDPLNIISFNSTGFVTLDGPVTVTQTSPVPLIPGVNTLTALVENTVNMSPTGLLVVGELTGCRKPALPPCVVTPPTGIGDGERPEVVYLEWLRAQGPRECEG